MGASAGDATGSGNINLSDVLAVKARASQSVASNTAFDLDLDGTITATGDAFYAKAYVASPARQASCQ